MYLPPPERPRVVPVRVRHRTTRRPSGGSQPAPPAPEDDRAPERVPTRLLVDRRPGPRRRTDVRSVGDHHARARRGGHRIARSTPTAGVMSRSTNSVVTDTPGAGSTLGAASKPTVAMQLVLWYQRLFEGRPSPCRFTPSCSAYALEALDDPWHSARSPAHVASSGPLPTVRPVGLGPGTRAAPHAPCRRC